MTRTSSDTRITTHEMRSIHSTLWDIFQDKEIAVDEASVYIGKMSTQRRRLLFYKMKFFGLAEKVKSRNKKGKPRWRLRRS